MMLRLTRKEWESIEGLDNQEDKATEELGCTKPTKERINMIRELFK